VRSSLPRRQQAVSRVVAGRPSPLRGASVRSGSRSRCRVCLVPYLLRHVTVLPSADQLHSSLARNGSELVVAAAGGACLGCTLFSGTGTASHPGRCCCIRVLACRCGWRRTVGVGHPSHPSFFRLPSTLDQVATKVDAAMCQIKAQHALTSRKDLYQDCRRIKPCMA
jgi:hypothetical protein